MLILLLVVCSALNAEPYPGYGYPQRSVMWGYYGQQPNPRSYMPQGTMAFASGDTIATNSYPGDQSIEEVTERRKTSYGVEEVEVEAPVKPKRKSAADEDETGGSWPFPTNKNQPSYLAFFPIMFGGAAPQGRDGGAYPASATAIANSFSTGKGGVATSHATSFGDPSLGAMFRNYLNRKAPKPEQIDD